MGEMETKRKKKMGRPPKPAGERRVHSWTLAMTRGELRRLKAEAKRQGVSPSVLLLRPWREKWDSERED
jgi:hypothetical protein